jgi:hypothetical protein
MHCSDLEACSDVCMIQPRPLATPPASLRQATRTKRRSVGREPKQLPPPPARATSWIVEGIVARCHRRWERAATLGRRAIRPRQLRTYPDPQPDSSACGPARLAGSLSLSLSLFSHTHTLTPSSSSLRPSSTTRACRPRSTSALMWRSSQPLSPLSPLSHTHSPPVLKLHPAHAPVAHTHTHTLSLSLCNLPTLAHEVCASERVLCIYSSGHVQAAQLGTCLDCPMTGGLRCLRQRHLLLLLINSPD